MIPPGRCHKQGSSLRSSSSLSDTPALVIVFPPIRDWSRCTAAIPLPVSRTSGPALGASTGWVPFFFCHISPSNTSSLNRLISFHVASNFPGGLNRTGTGNTYIRDPTIWCLAGTKNKDFKTGSTGAANDFARIIASSLAKH